MSLVKELQQLIQTDGVVTGRVIAIIGTSMVVATASGQIGVSVNGDLHVGGSGYRLFHFLPLILGNGQHEENYHFLVSAFHFFVWLQHVLE
jgi:hypothetical protein